MFNNSRFVPKIVRLFVSLNNSISSEMFISTFVIFSAKYLRYLLALYLKSVNLDPDSVRFAYDEIIEKGAIPVSLPSMMPWGRMTAFFADPDGNIHELYSLNPGEGV